MTLGLIVTACKHQDTGEVEASEYAAADSVVQEESSSDCIQVVKDETAADGTRTIAAKPSSAVCSRLIEVSVKEGIITNVSFTGGCPGNTQGVAILVNGMKVQEAIDKLDNVECADKGTSCPDQLTDILKLFLE